MVTLYDKTEMQKKMFMLEMLARTRILNNADIQSTLSQHPDWTLDPNYAANNPTTTTPSANLTADQIKTAFCRYGYTPSDADLQYWALKPATDLNKFARQIAGKER